MALISQSPKGCFHSVCQIAEERNEFKETIERPVGISEINSGRIKSVKIIVKYIVNEILFFKIRERRTS